MRTTIPLPALALQGIVLAAVIALLLPSCAPDPTIPRPVFVITLGDIIGAIAFVLTAIAVIVLTCLNYRDKSKPPGL